MVAIGKMTQIGDILKIGSPESVVNEWYAANQTQRTYLGLSEIGHECKRYLWYVHNGYAKKAIDGRILRLFKLGENIERQAVIDLISSGFKVRNCQHEISFEYNGLKLVGHKDGEISGLTESSKWHILEIKSASEKNFNKIKKMGYESYDSKYKCQVHVYMLGSKLKNALAWVENKNTSKVYTERIKLDTTYALFMLERAFDTMSMEYEPERTCHRVDWYKAKWCDFYETCWRIS